MRLGEGVDVPALDDNQPSNNEKEKSDFFACDWGSPMCWMG